MSAVNMLVRRDGDVLRFFVYSIDIIRHLTETPRGKAYRIEGRPNIDLWIAVLRNGTATTYYPHDSEAAGKALAPEAGQQPHET